MGNQTEGLEFTPRQYMILNSTDEPIQMAYDGETFTVPAGYDVVPQDSDHPSAPYSGKDSEGRYIPGSLILSDIHEQRWVTDAGVRPAVWSAMDAIKHCLGIDMKTREANSEYAKKGVSVISTGASPEDVARVRAQGEARYRTWQITWARATVNGYQERAAKWRSIGLQPEPPGPEYDKAVYVMEQARRTRQGLELDSEAALNDMLDAKIRELASAKATPGVDVKALADALRGDPEFMKMLRAQLVMAGQARKKD
jgi:hypothetical protein